MASDEEVSEEEAEMQGEDLSSEELADEQIEDDLPNYHFQMDHYDKEVDCLLEQMQNVVQEEKYADLADDFGCAVDNMADVLVDVSDEETHQISRENDLKDEEEIYPGSKRKLGVVMLLLCVFMIRYRLSDETMQCLLSLIGLLLPENSQLITSLYGFRKYLTKFTFLPDIHYYCSFCYSHYDKNAQRCPNMVCSKDLTESGAVSYFIKHKLMSQLQVLFQRKAFTDAVRTHRFEHLRTVPKGCIQDVYDGLLYQELYNKGFLKNPDNLSFAMNTDGVAIFKSSKVSMWPVYLLVNELPLKQRKARENTLFYGLWLSAKKPMMWSFLQPLYYDLKALETGVEMKDHNNITFTCQATLLTCTCDLPAKAMVCNSIQFNGAYGCWHCLQRGETARTSGGGNVHVFPFKEENPGGPKRTKELVRENVNQVIQNIKNGKSDYMVNGIKGPSCLMYIKNFDFVNGFIIDYMHGVCSGVTKLLLTLWFSNNHKDALFNFHGARLQVNNMLKQIKPTLNITRIPRSLDEMVHWKSSEYRNFLLYWGIPVMSKILEKSHLIHFCLFVKAIFLLSQESIKPEDLLLAETLLFKFVGDFAENYSLRYMTLNVHQLVHLTDMVRHAGPLFANNCFIFEDLNGFIVSHIHGTQGIDSQVVRTINMIQALPILQEKFGGTDLEADAYLASIQDTASRSTWNALEYVNGIYSIGKIVIESISAPSEIHAFKKLIPNFSNNIKSWLRIYISATNSYVYGSLYKRVKRRNQSVVKYSENNTYQYGLVKYFAQCADENVSKKYFAIIVPFQLRSAYDSSIHVRAVDMLDEIKVIFVENILTTCLYINTGCGKYVCDIPNRYDTD